jgi:hypothetical protein
MAATPRRRRTSIPVTGRVGPEDSTVGGGDGGVGVGGEAVGAGGGDGDGGMAVSVTLTLAVAPGEIENDTGVDDGW